MIELNDLRPFCACSTAPGLSGLAVIRASGNGLDLLLDKCVRVIRGSDDTVKSFSDMKGYTASYASIFDPETKEEIDKVIITRFVSPFSYTGDDMAEISCHGGSSVKQKILEVLYNCGLRPALPGEFTKQAFVNGKLDLSEAEAVMDVIAADSTKALKAANSQLYGKLSRELEAIEKELYRAMSLIEMIVEFPEHDDTPENEEEIVNIISEAIEKTTELIKTYGRGRILSERMNIALCGSPNSGKSSLLNAVAGYDRAIVTNVPGTTRDLLELRVEIEGIPVTLVDTAGIRETEDEIEAIGVKLAKKAFDDADLVLYLIAPDAETIETKKQLEELYAASEGNTYKDKTVLVFSKNDLGENPNKADLEKLANRNISVSSVAAGSISELEKLISDYYNEVGGSSQSEITVTNRRHFDILTNANNLLANALETVNLGVGVDIASSVLRCALDEFGNITGKAVSAELADTIFAGFCIGK